MRNQPLHATSLTQAGHLWLFGCVILRLLVRSPIFLGTLLLTSHAGATPPQTSSPPPKKSAAGAPASWHAVEKQAEHAKQRQAQAQKAGRKDLALRLQALEKQWREVLQTLKQTAQLEEQAVETEKKLLEVEAQTERAHLLVEQTEARRERALHRLRELKLEPKAPSSSHSSSEQKSPE